MSNGLLIALAGFILALGPLVFIHEFGHFIVAKAFKIGVPVFSLGFGPRIFGFRRGETDYRLSAIPLGGYVRLAGDEADENRVGAPEEFLSRPKYQRFLVFVAGAVFNIVLAFVLMWGYFWIWGDREPVEYPVVLDIVDNSPAASAGVLPGDQLIAIGGVDWLSDRTAFELKVQLNPGKQQPLTIEREGERRELSIQLGSHPDDEARGFAGWYFVGGRPPAIMSVDPDGPAGQAGLQAGDLILSSGDMEKVNYGEWLEQLASSAGVELPVSVMREGTVHDLRITPEDDGSGKGVIGISVQPRAVQERVVEVGFLQAASMSVRHNVNWSTTLFLAIKNMIQKRSAKGLSGPVGIAEVSGQALRQGLDTFLQFMAFISLQLGILNLLPIPVLDGGHISVLLIEGVMRRDLSERVKERVMQVGFVFLLALMSFVIIQDVRRLF